MDSYQGSVSNIEESAASHIKALPVKPTVFGLANIGNALNASVPHESLVGVPMVRGAFHLEHCGERIKVFLCHGRVVKAIWFMSIPRVSVSMVICLMF